MNKTYTLKVIDVKKETADAVTISFKQPALKKIKYKAGQYLTLIFRINGRRYIRPYSFSSSPSVDKNIEVTVKRVQNGTVSNHINDLVKNDDLIEVMEPMGDFIYSPLQDTFGDIYLWGVGSGVTPLISLAKEILFSDSSRNVHLIYGNRNFESTMFTDQINELQLKYSDRFNVSHFHTRPLTDYQDTVCIKGRIDQDNIVKLLESDCNVKTSMHYICGPGGFKEAVTKALKSFEIVSIHSEDFELVKDPKDFEDVFTENIKLKFNNEIFEIEVVKGKTILEAALDSNIDLPYSCQTGKCDTCQGRLITGELKMVGLTDDRKDLEANAFLLCCSHPLSKNVYIEI